MEKKFGLKKYGAIIMLSILVLFCVLGQVFNIVNTPAHMILESLMYYTWQSNFFVLVVSIIMLVFEIRALRGHAIPHWARVLQFVAVVAIALTYIVFTLMLTPMMFAMGQAAYFATPVNLFLHNLVPIFAIVEWLLFGSALAVSKKEVLFSQIPPIAYTIFMFACVVAGLTFNGDVVPYYFFNFVDNGWFALGGGKVGVAYCLVFMAFFYTLMSYFLWWFGKKMENERLATGTSKAKKSRAKKQ